VRVLCGEPCITMLRITMRNEITKDDRTSFYFRDTESEWVRKKARYAVGSDWVDC
jgi:hypothetical protein